jgi:peptide deformylase
MTVQPIVLYMNDPAALRQKSTPVSTMDRHVRKLILDLKETLLENGNGIGLAAPQINDHRNVVVVRLGGGRAEREPGPPTAIVNPKILEARDLQPDFDGCLSFPGLYGETLRPHLLSVTGLDEAGKSFERTFEGFDAVVLHHEIDHLNGVLFIDRVATPEDLYTIVKCDNGKQVRVPLRTVAPT